MLPAAWVTSVRLALASVPRPPHPAPRTRLRVTPTGPVMPNHPAALDGPGTRTQPLSVQLTCIFCL